MCIWHQAIGRTDVLWGILGAKGLLIGVFSLVFAILLWLNMAVADRLAPAIVPDSDEQRTLIPLRTALKKRSKLVRTLLAIVLGILIGLPAAAQWEQWLMFRNNQSFGVADPLFNKDIGFYVFQLPFFEFLVAWAFGALVLISIVIDFSALHQWFYSPARNSRASDSSGKSASVGIARLLGLGTCSELLALAFRSHTFHTWCSERRNVYRC